MHLPLKIVLRKFGDRYQAYCITYKTHAMATHHRGTGCPVDRYINLHIEDMEGINTGPDNNNGSTSGSDTTVAFGGSEADGHPQQTSTQQPSHVNSTHERNIQFTSMSRGQRKPTSRRFGLHSMRATKSLSCASATTCLNPNTY